MNWLPAQLMQVKHLRLPGDIEARKKAPHVIELAESIGKRTGKRPIHLPTVEYPSKELLSGGDRMAAQLLLGYRSVWVQPVSQLTPQERRDIIRDENLHRRVIDRDALIRQRVEEAAAEIETARMLADGCARKTCGHPEARHSGPHGDCLECKCHVFISFADDEPRKPGRPKTAKGEARELVAKQLGTTAEAIRVSEYRAAQEIADKNTLSEPATTPPVETYGLPLLTDVEADQVRAAQAAFDDADQALRRAQAALGRIDRHSPFAAVAGGLSIATHQLASQVRAARPVAACPYCKRLPHFLPGCPGCKVLGFVGAEAMLGVADELKLGGDKAMVVALGGRMVSYAYVRSGKGQAKPAPKAKSITVLDENDKPLLPKDGEIREEDLPF